MKLALPSLIIEVTSRKFGILQTQINVNTPLDVANRQVSINRHNRNRPYQQLPIRQFAPV